MGRRQPQTIKRRRAHSFLQGIFVDIARHLSLLTIGLIVASFFIPEMAGLPLAVVVASFFVLIVFAYLLAGAFASRREETTPPPGESAPDSQPLSRRSRSD